MRMRARPSKGLCGAALESGVLEMVSKPTLAVSRSGVVAVVRAWGTCAGTGCTDVAKRGGPG